MWSSARGFWSHRPKSSECPFDVAWVSTFGAGSSAISKIVKDTNVLRTSSAWKDVPKHIGVVNRRDRSIGNIVLSRKRFALAGTVVNRGVTSRCTPVSVAGIGASCKSCDMMVGVSAITSHTNGRRFRTDGGNCKSRNVVYAAQCIECSLQYVGQTAQELLARINNHRSSCSRSNGGEEEGGSIKEHQDLEGGEKALVHHMVSVHGKNNDVEFSAMYRFTICEKDASPRSLDFTEQSWITKFGTSRPEGINVANSCDVRQNLVRRNVE